MKIKNCICPEHENADIRPYLPIMRCPGEACTCKDCEGFRKATQAMLDSKELEDRLAGLITRALVGSVFPEIRRAIAELEKGTPEEVAGLGSEIQAGIADGISAFTAQLARKLGSSPDSAATIHIQGMAFIQTSLLSMQTCLQDDLKKHSFHAGVNLSIVKALEESKLGRAILRKKKEPDDTIVIN